MPEAGFLVSDDFESYSSNSDAVAVYGSGNVSGFNSTGGRDGSKGLVNGSLKSTAIAGTAAIVAGCTSFSGGSVMEFYGPNALHSADILYLRVGIDSNELLYYDTGTGKNYVRTTMRPEGSIWRYVEAQFLPDTAAGYIHLALEGVRVFDLFGSTAVTNTISYILYTSQFIDDVYARNPRATDYLGATIDYSSVGNGADFAGDYRSRHLLPGDPTRSGHVQVTQQYWIAAKTPPLENAQVTQQYWIVPWTPGGSHGTVQVTQQYWIVAYRAKGPRTRAQVFGVARK